MNDKNDMSVFAKIAETNFWGSKESVSGPGSTLPATKSLRSRLPDIFRSLRIRSLVDAPCGDMNWMRHVEYPLERYIGIDLVSSLIEKLRSEPTPPSPHFQSQHFQVGNIVTDILPTADALFCRDCLVHLPYAAIETAWTLWKQAGFRYVLTTTFPEAENKDCKAGDWRALNLSQVPFNWGEPHMIIPDGDGLAPPYDTKSIGIWAL